MRPVEFVEYSRYIGKYESRYCNTYVHMNYFPPSGTNIYELPTARSISHLCTVLYIYSIIPENYSTRVYTCTGR